MGKKTITGFSTSMKILISLIRLDLTLLFRNGVLYAAAIITILYTLILQILPRQNFTDVLIILIFTDPVMLGFMFTGVMVLFEKSGNTLQAMSVTPVRPGQYLLSKAIALTLVAMVASLIMTLAGVGFDFNLLYFGAAVTLSSVLFVFIGFTGVSRVKTFNQYFLVIPLFMVPFSLPMLNFLGITTTWLWFLIPTQGSLILFSAAIKNNSTVSLPEIIYAFFILIVFTWLAFRVALKNWHRAINT